MANPVVQTAVCTCPFGAAPATLTVTSQQTVTMGKMPTATILDGAPMANVPTFGMCSNPANPTVPATVSWVPGCPTVLVCKRPLLNNTSKLICSYGGVIQVSITPAMTVKVP